MQEAHLHGERLDIRHRLHSLNTVRLICELGLVSKDLFFFPTVQSRINLWLVSMVKVRDR